MNKETPQRGAKTRKGTEPDVEQETASIIAQAREEAEREAAAIIAEED